jgi:cyclophilin family peptidyl-prolyl cis-trans isomerase
VVPNTGSSRYLFSVATEKRERQRANRQQKVELQEQQEKRDQFRHYGFIAAIVAVVIVAGLGLLALTGGGDETEAADGDHMAQSDDGASTDDGTTTDDTADAGTAAEPLPCPAEDGSSSQVLEFPAAPPDCLVDGASYTAVFDTSAGEMTAELDPAAAPTTVNNFVYLARYHYYDGSLFHRVIQDFMIQGGDATGNPPGTGGPGYTIGEEPPADGYQIGSLAMAKRTAPGTTGAQFFIVTGPQGESLPPEYSLFGQVTEGVDVATSIQSVSTDPVDKPIDDVVINSITIVEG